MGHALAQVRIARMSQLSEDVIINTFHFETPNAGVTVANANDIVAQLRDFYLIVPTGAAFSVREHFSSIIADTGHEIRVYNMADAKPRPPVLIDTLAIPRNVNKTPMPAEVALVMSLRATPRPGVDPRRLRGRVYLGPISATANTVSDSDGRPTADILLSVANSGARLMEAGLVVGAPVLSVFSKQMLLTGQDSDGLAHIIQVRVNDAWDTQRRRGADPIANTDRFRSVGTSP